MEPSHTNYPKVFLTGNAPITFYIESSLKKAKINRTTVIIPYSIQSCLNKTSQSTTGLSVQAQQLW
jgi:hypothetical protein